MPAARRFHFICGQDDFLVTRAGKERFDELARTAADEFSTEIIDGYAGNVAEVSTAIARFREAVLTVPLFGGRRVVWLKDVNFLADTVTGRAEGTLNLLSDLQELLGSVEPEETAVLITAAPVDRRRSFPKWCEKNADFVLLGGEGESAGEALAAVAREEAKEQGASFGPGALELLLARAGSNTRLLVEEVRKLATYASRPVATVATAGTVDSDAPVVIEESHVSALTPNAAEGDFFEAAEAFFSGDLQWTLAALRRHFFTGGSARPVISAFQNRNRLLMQVRALIDAGQVTVGARGLEGLPRVAARFSERLGEAAGEKSSFNLFTQNAWYLGKLVTGSKLPPLRRLIDNQHAFVAAFEECVRRPDEEEAVLRDMAVSCLA